MRIECAHIVQRNFITQLAAIKCVILFLHTNKYELFSLSSNLEDAATKQ